MPRLTKTLTARGKAVRNIVDKARRRAELSEKQALRIATAETRAQRKR
jgi:hypothetical protein